MVFSVPPGTFVFDVVSVAGITFYFFLLLLLLFYGIIFAPAVPVSVVAGYFTAGIISAEDPVSSSAIFGSWYHIAAAATIFAVVVVAAASITLLLQFPFLLLLISLLFSHAVLIPARRILKIFNPKLYVTAGNTARPTLRMATSSWCSLCGA